MLATNDNYAPYAGVTITSLLDNSSNEYIYDIYIFYTELSSDNISRFEKMNQQYKNCRDGIQIRCININSYIDKEVPLYENFHFSKDSIVINGIEYSKNRRGLNFVIIDLKQQKVVKSFNVDTYDDAFLLLR